MNALRNASEPTYCNLLLDGLAGSSLLPEGQLRHLAARYAAWARSPNPDVAKQLGDRLVASGLLTAYQVEQVLAGHGSKLRLGQYRILEPIGAGGMGQVFRAEHELMQRLVAIKLLERQTDENANAGFLREIRAAGRLHHPNIVTAFDADVNDGRLYLVMEYVPGVDLGRLVARGGPLPVVLACEYVRQTAVALQHALDRDLLHRDIKPTNLLVYNHHYPDTWPPRTAPVVKLLDLGLACLTRDASPGALAGTPEYMAPELARDSQLLDVRSDLYSLGCTFFYLLTGRPPYRGDHWTETLLAHQEDPIPSPAAVRPDVPPALCAVVLRLLAKDANDRWSTPGELAADLEAWLSDNALSLLGTTADSPAESVAPTVKNLAEQTPHATANDVNVAPPQRRWLPVIAVAALVVLLLFGFQTLPRRKAAEIQPQPAPRLPAASEQGVQIAGRAERYRTLAAPLAAAKDGDTIEIAGGQTLVCPPLTWTGKSLTLRGGPGERPVLLLEAARAAEFWEALFSSDSALSLESLDLGHQPGPAEQRATAHLLSVRGPRLALKNCRLHAPDSTAVVACRQGGILELDNCQITAQATALSVEVMATETCQVRVTNSRLVVKEENATALAVWATSRAPTSALAVSLENNHIKAGRVLGLTALPGRIEVTARHNRFHCRQALLSLAAWPVNEPWQQRITWRGEKNEYDAPARRLLLDGKTQEQVFGDDGPQS